MQRVVCCSSVIDSLGWILRVLSVEQISVIYKLALSPFSPEIVPKLRCTRVVFWMVINRCFAMVLMWRIQLRRSWSMARWFSCEPWSRGTRQRKVLHRRWPSQSDTAVCADSRSSNLGVHFTVQVLSCQLISTAIMTINISKCLQYGDIFTKCLQYGDNVGQFTGKKQHNNCVTGIVAESLNDTTIIVKCPLNTVILYHPLN